MLQNLSALLEQYTTFSWGTHLVAKDALKVLASKPCSLRVPVTLTLCDKGPHDAVRDNGPNHQGVGNHIRDDHPCKGTSWPISKRTG